MPALLRSRLRLLWLLPALLLATPVLSSPGVVASIPPLHSLVSAVMDGVGTPHLLLRGGQSPHSFSLRPSDARLLADADLVLWIGPPLELPLQRILPTLGQGRAVALIDAPGVQTLPLRELHEDPHEGGHTHGGPLDPHIWLSPVNAVAMVARIAQALATVDPDNAARYRQNAQQLTARLHALDRELAARLADLDGRYSLFHDAYQYFEERYGLHPVGSVTTHPERSPGAEHLHELLETLRTAQVRCLFSEPQFTPRLADMISRELGIRHAVLDPLGADLPPGPDAYPQLMRQIADTLLDCLGGETR